MLYNSYQLPKNIFKEKNMEELSGYDDSLIENLRNDEELSNMPKLNIIVIGKSGVGKSSLLNSIFGEKLVPIGSGLPITLHCQKYALQDSPITIFDSKDIETGMGKEEYNEFYDVINKQNNSLNKDDYIHICWYCVSEVGEGLEPNEVDIIEKIQKKIPVIVVVTKSVGGAAARKFVEDIQKILIHLGNIDIIPVMAFKISKDSEFGEINIKAHGIDKLIEKCYYLLPASIQDTFSAYQKVKMDLKEKKANAR
jgi:predicted GTPase